MLGYFCLPVFLSPCTLYPRILKRFVLQFHGICLHTLKFQMTNVKFGFFRMSFSEKEFNQRYCHRLHFNTVKWHNYLRRKHVVESMSSILKVIVTSCGMSSGQRSFVDDQSFTFILTLLKPSSSSSSSSS